VSAQGVTGGGGPGRRSAVVMGGRGGDSKWQWLAAAVQVRWRQKGREGVALGQKLKWGVRELWVRSGGNRR
jgi:hypothetical protein